MAILPFHLDEDMIKIAVVGAGHLGSIHARLWNEQPEAELAAIVDPDEMRGRAVAEQHGTPWFATLDELEGVDAVVIAAPTSRHHSLALRCLELGYHIFIEKPVTATHDEALELISKAATIDVVVQVGHVERFNPAVLSLAPYHVDPLFIEGHRLSVFKPRAIDVSVVHDLMIHDIDLLLWMTKSKVTEVQATGVAVLTETPDICNARLTFENGCVANLTASRISVKPMRKLRIFQRDTYLSLDLAAGSVEMFRLIDGSMLEPDHQIPVTNVATAHGDRLIVMDQPKVENVNAIAEEQRLFLRSIKEGVAAPVTLREGAEAVRVAEMIESLF
jgi:predicted dehydrogenase